MRNYRRLTGWLIGGWFTFAVMAAALHLFRNDSERVGVAVAIAAAAPLVVFAAWFAASAAFREFALSLNPRVLTALHTWRIMGFVFVLLETYRLLPAMFALPAGYGDMAIGATASLVAWQLAEPRYRNSFIAWQVLGIADLIIAVSMGTTSRLLDPSGVSMLPMTVLPLSIVPTFLVPLFLIFHVISIAQARRWRVARPTAKADGASGGLTSKLPVVTRSS
jgi:hypothetical protein